MDALRHVLAWSVALMTACVFDSDDCSKDPSACSNETGEGSCQTCHSPMVCTLAEECEECPAGTVTCPCDHGMCDHGTCKSGVDSDGTKWSMCFPADLISCASDPCPGDTYCTDELVCAWAK